LFISQNKYPNLLSKVRGFGLYGAVDLPDESSRDKVMTKLREKGESYNQRLIVTFYNYLLSIVVVVFTTIHVTKLMRLILDIYMTPSPWWKHCFFCSIRPSSSISNGNFSKCCTFNLLIVII